jgi:hypothetical protein
MTSRQSLQQTLAHRAVGRVPIDIGATPVTGMHVSCVEALRRHFGLEARPVKVQEPYQMLGAIDEDLACAVGVDIIGIGPRNTLFGFPSENWREFSLPWGQEVLVPERFQTRVEPDGDLLIYPEGDLSAPASGRMPAGGFFFDTIVRQEPLVETALDPSDNLEEFGPASPDDIRHVKDEVARIARSPRGRVANFGGTGLGDIALVPAPFLKHPRGVRDIEEWYISTLTRPDYVHAIFSRQCDIALENLEAYRRIVGDQIDVLYVCGTDFGTQQSTFCSVDTFSRLYAPYYKRLNDWVHTHTAWKTFKHSCGAVEPLIHQFIECGFDVLNPVQCSARGMKPWDLVDRYGGRIVFWGGGVDTQYTLPFATPEEVRAEVLSRCEVFARKGGFVFNTIHNIQAGTPTDNIVALLDALKEYNGIA